ncbi:uncharacterized protein LOC108674186 [Hyalella azteca]|uniref:Uncharacterized protein LOC108674186 n=1 Tax=Hyalella azteca TaxID=294128 RepID=A0A8B7NXI2_HYAAZ|nr:uncharacterized protein LOC108674186 [Hyalella azteca]
MKKAWEIISETYPHIQAYGCLAHCLNLVFNDIMKVKSLSKLSAESVAVLKEIKNSHKLTAMLKAEHLKSRNDPQAEPEITPTMKTLKLSVKTRWGSTVNCLESLQSNKHSLQALTINAESKSSIESNTKKTILSEVFWDKVEGSLALLKPLADAIKNVEGDNVPLSIVMETFSKLENEIVKKVGKSPVLKSEEDTVRGIIKKRKEFATKKIHFAANLLDPNHRGCHLNDEEVVDAFQVLDEIATSMPCVNGGKLFREIADYRSKQKLFHKPYIWNAVKHTTPSTWWSGLCGSTELSKIAKLRATVRGSGGYERRACMIRCSNVALTARNCVQQHVVHVAAGVYA